MMMQYNSCTTTMAMTVMAVMLLMVIHHVTESFVVPVIPQHKTPRHHNIVAKTTSNIHSNTKQKRNPSLASSSSSRYDEDDKDSWDNESDYKEFEKSLKDDPDLEEFDFDLQDLGISNVLEQGETIMSLEDVAAIKREATEAINDIFDKRLEDIEKLRDNFQKDAIRTKQRMNEASEARAAQAKTKLLAKIDSFLTETSDARSSLKEAAEADQNMIGRGLSFGSWGMNKLGEEVITATSSGTTLFASSSDNSDTISADEQQISDSSTMTRVVIIVDESKDKQDVKVAKALANLLSTEDVICDVVTPLQCKTGGGDYAKVAILFSSTYFDRDGLELTLEKLLKRTSTSGGSLPPTHLMLVSSLGTTRTDKMPYSMQNLLGRKLSKKESMEEAIVKRCREGLMGGTIPLDFTVVKWGAVQDEIKKSNDDSSSLPVDLTYGDALDGDISVDDAAQVLYQTVALQKYAHNSTYSVISTGAGATDIEQSEWDDLFLKLDGPELKRVTLMKDASKEEVKKKYELLCEYLEGWAEESFASSKKSGLSTPVTVHNTAPNKVEIRFKSTNTGSNYRSAKEERTLEEARRTPSSKSSDNKSSATPNVVGKQKKEGGIEIVVEIVSASGELRVRAKRCNMQPDGTTTIKEMSESTILNRLNDALKYWKTQET